MLETSAVPNGPVELEFDPLPVEPFLPREVNPDMFLNIAGVSYLRTSCL